MTDVSRYDEEAEAEGRRLRTDERAEHDQETLERADMSLTPLGRWCEANPRKAAAQIDTLQAILRTMAPYWHEGLTTHGLVEFYDCQELECRRLRDRLRPIGVVVS